MVLVFNIALAQMHTSLTKLAIKYMCIYIKYATHVYFCLSRMRWGVSLSVED